MRERTREETYIAFLETAPQAISEGIDFFTYADEHNIPDHYCVRYSQMRAEYQKEQAIAAQKKQLEALEKEVMQETGLLQA